MKLERTTSKIISYFKISRPINILLGSTAVLISATFFQNFPDILNIIFAMMVVMFLNAGANCVNDIYDIEIDKINRPNRSLPAGKLSINEVKNFAVILFLIGNGISFYLGNFPFIISLIIATPLMVLYASKLKKIALIGNLLVSFILGLTFIFASTVFGNYMIGVVPAVLAFLLTLIREIVKDMEDIDGDKKYGANTLPIFLGIERTKIIVSALMMLLVVVIIIPYLMGIYGIYYLLVVMNSIGIPMIFMIFYIFISRNKNKYSLLAKVLKVEIFFGLLSIYLGKF
ncbi:MAG: geranylgeranylglycerol-phosphate geranylgeranyltransferase [Candidatus Marinimicrobia bacterium]|nr:geranylgeranylglycerol-phosphate geranylgeranyltransferase [Candidatus Neomarinimicrobiota bacterium]